MHQNSREKCCFGRISNRTLFLRNKKSALPMVIVSILPHVKFEPNDHRENAPHSTSIALSLKIFPQNDRKRSVFVNFDGFSKSTPG